MSKRSKFFVAEHMIVAPELIGQPLAPRWRRGLALLIDWILLVIPTVPLSLAVALAMLHHADPAAFAALRKYESADPAVRKQAYRDLARLMARLDAPGLPAAVRAAVEEHDLDRAGVLLEGYTVDINLRIGGEAAEFPPGTKTVRLELAKLIPPLLRILVFYGIGAVYFTLLTRRGATLGKKLLGLRVARLDGSRLSLFDSLERAAAYIEIPATLGFALLALWREPNRRMPHDRVAETVVLRVAKASPSVASDLPAPAKVALTEP